MIGPPRCLVSTSSATGCLRENVRIEYSIPIPRTHSNLVKFPHCDAEYDNVVLALEQILQAPASGFTYGMGEKGLKEGTMAQPRDRFHEPINLGHSHINPRLCMFTPQLEITSRLTLSLKPRSHSFSHVW